MTRPKKINLFLDVYTHSLVMYIISIYTWVIHEKQSLWAVFLDHAVRVGSEVRLIGGQRELFRHRARQDRMLGHCWSFTVNTKKMKMKMKNANTIAVCYFTQEIDRLKLCQLAHILIFIAQPSPVISLCILETKGSSWPFKVGP